MNSTSILDLDEHTIQYILCFLPGQYVIRCSCVCKDWANIIYQPYFPQLYFSRAKAPLQLVLEKQNNIFLAQLDATSFELPRFTSVLNLNIGQRFGKRPLKISICKSTGWIVAINYSYSLAAGKQCNDRPYHIYNPITGQHIVIQPTNRDDLDWLSCTLVFAQKSNQLKLLVYSGKNLAKHTEADIQTIGTNTWRTIGQVPCDHYGCGQPPVLLDGCYHWLDYKKMVINSFDAETEVFKVIQIPSVFNNDRFNLGLLDNCLCLIGVVSERYKVGELWMMHNYGDEDSWSKKFSLSDLSPFEDGSVFDPVICLKNGKILILVNQNTMLYSTGKTRSAVIWYNSRAGLYDLIRYFGRYWTRETKREKKRESMNEPGTSQAPSIRLQELAVPQAFCQRIL